MGQTYVDVAAAQADMGIMTMGASTGNGGNTTTGGAWLYWTDAGFTGQGWYWDDPNNYVKTGWEQAVAKDGGYVNGCKGNEDGGKHTDSFEDFLYHVSQRHTDNLDYILGGWGPREKTYFITTNPKLEEYGCVEWR